MTYTEESFINNMKKVYEKDKDEELKDYFDK